MSYMKEAFLDEMHRIEKQTGIDILAVQQAWNDLLDKKFDGFGLEHFRGMAALAQETGYDFLDLVDVYCRVREENEADGEPFNWELFCGITRERDW